MAPMKGMKRGRSPMKGMKGSRSASKGPAMKKMKVAPMKRAVTPMKKSKVQLNMNSIIKFLKDEDNCHVKGPSSGRQMLIKTAKLALGKGAASDQRGEYQEKALVDIEEVLRGALGYWQALVLTAEDSVAVATAEKAAAQGEQDTAQGVLDTQSEEIEKIRQELSAANKAVKEAQKALKKATKEGKTSSDELAGACDLAKTNESAMGRVETAKQDLTEAEAAKKPLAAAEKDAHKAVDKKSKVVANAQGHLAVEQSGLEKCQDVLAVFNSLRDRTAKRSPRKSKAKTESDGEASPSKRSPSFLDKVASTILGIKPEPEQTEEAAAE